MKKKIALFCTSLEIGGAERNISYLLKEFHEQYDLHLILLNNIFYFEVPRGIKIHILNKKLNKPVIKVLAIPIYSFLLLNYMRVNNINLCLSFLARPNWINCFAKILSKNTIHAISERSAPSQKYNHRSIKGVIGLYLTKFLFKRADIIVCVSDYTKKKFQSKLHIEENKLKVIHNPIYNSNSNTGVENFQLQKGEIFKFTTVAKFRKEKNLELIVDAVELIKDVEFTFDIIGYGYLYKSIEQLIIKKKLENRIKLLGRKNNIQDYLRKSDCFVLTSNYEGMPNAILEALCNDLPIISTDCVSGPREILAPNTNYDQNIYSLEIAEYGILIPINNAQELALAMKKIINDENLRKSYILKAKDRTVSFSPEKTIKLYKNIFEL